MGTGGFVGGVGIGTTPLDFMEYATDGAAQTAYVTNGTEYTSQYPPLQNDTYVKATTNGGGAYSPYFCTDPAKSLIDGTGSNSWLSASGSYTDQRFHIDLGAAFVVTRIYYEPNHESGAHTDYSSKTFTFWGSNSATAFAELTYGDDTDWTQLTTDVSEFVQHVAANTADPHYIAVTNSVAYRYYAIKISDSWGTTYAGFRRIELQTTTLNLQSYSENTIKTEGYYSLKGVAAITDSLNKTLTRTVSPTINLSNKTRIAFDIYSSRTGSNLKIGIHDSGGTTTEITPNIASANTWQHVVWDISAVANANKDVIDSVIVTVINADAANTFYIDNIFGIGPGQ